ASRVARRFHRLLHTHFAPTQCPDGGCEPDVDGSGDKHESRPPRRLREGERTVPAHGAAGALDKTGGSKSASSALRTQSCHRAKHRVKARHSKAQDCSSHSAYSSIPVTCVFTSSRFDEAMIEILTQSIYPKFALKLFGTHTSSG